jgi:mono/diheme cytochrome c family protein
VGGPELNTRNHGGELRRTNGGGEMRAAILVVALAFGVGMLVPGMAGSADPAKGEASFKKFCASCHGPAGKGDGPMGARMNPKLKDFTDKPYNASMKDDYLAKIILEGGKAVGKSPMMPKTGGALKVNEVDDVIAYIRSVAK